MTTLNYDDYELYHHGILGMKWGIRRYQNPDGSYTEEGKRRKSKGNEYSEDYWNAHDKKDPKYMSDKELQKRINRLNNERQYQNLTEGKVEKIGKKFVEDILTKGLEAVAAAYIIKKTSKYIPEAMDYIGDYLKEAWNGFGWI